MPSGRTHDLITLIVALPTFFACWIVTQSVALAIVATGATIFAGFMFGPDLDIKSQQLRRWGPARIFWIPYRVVFGHRSHLSHGLLFGTLIRVVYLTGMLALLVFALLCAWTIYLRSGLPDLSVVLSSWSSISLRMQSMVGSGASWAALFGLWWGAALHTIADTGWSMVRKAFQIF